jgi:hypothetical protein
VSACCFERACHIRMHGNVAVTNKAQIGSSAIGSGAVWPSVPIIARAWSEMSGPKSVDVQGDAQRMIRQRGSRARGDKRLVAHLLGVSTSVVLMCGVTPLSASADVDPPRTGRAEGNPVTDDVHNGNGARNHNIFSMKSPTNNHGYQHTSTSTAGGMTSIYNAMCRYVRVCRITWQPGPQKTEPTTRSKAGSRAPNNVDTQGPSTPGTSTFFYAGPLGVMMGTSTPPTSPRR